MSKELREQFEKKNGYPVNILYRELESDYIEIDYVIWLESKLKEAEEKNKPKKFTIDFNGNVKCLVRINNNIPYIKSAVNSYGESIDILDIAVYLTKENELKKQ